MSISEYFKCHILIIWLSIILRYGTIFVFYIYKFVLQ